jgi:hypothetical protein
VTGPGEPQFHHGNQALAATQDLGVLSVLLQQGDGFRNGFGSEILKGWRDHGATSFDVEAFVAKKLPECCSTRGVPYITADIAGESLWQFWQSWQF